ncbi:TrbC/VirB2 family protein [Vibrio parahaemolyticus]|nr:TrbC/VirB2 family protein [Vibrio parahaemolyticus]HBC3550347.1 TrbC/VirB2 family protein [Vibrio parahaemolyticus]
MKVENIENVTKAEKKEVSKGRQLMANLWLLVCLVMLPEIAMANPISDGVDWVLELLTDGIARSLAIIGIVVLGYMAWAGQITGSACGKFVGGIVLVFGGATIVDLIIAAVA